MHDHPEHDAPLENHTSFAYSMTSAMASYLDGIAAVGSIRKAHLSLATGFIADARRMAHIAEESLMANALSGALADLHGKGLDR